MRLPLTVTLISMALPAIAEETRQLDAHVHGHGELNIAFDGHQVTMELHAPGADIVGFEYEAASADDRAAIDAAVATLARPLELFVLPAAAECSVSRASAGLESGATSHTEFHAEYLLTCGNPGALTEIAFAYFDSFPNALELEVQVISPTGASAFEVERDEPVLDLRGVTGS